MAQKTKFIQLTVCKFAGITKEPDKVDVIIPKKIIKSVVEVDGQVSGGGSYVYVTEAVGNFGLSLRVTQPPHIILDRLERVIDTGK